MADRQALASRLATAGCDAQTTGTDWHTAGDFSPPAPPGEGLALGRRLPSNATPRMPIQFDLKYFNKGANRIDKLQVINRGTETAYDVSLSLPENAGLDLRMGGVTTISKIPGGGKSVTIDVLRLRRFAGRGGKEDAFDVTVTARTDGSETVSQDVFLDLNC